MTLRSIPACPTPVGRSHRLEHAPASRCARASGSLIWAIWPAHSGRKGAPSPRARLRHQCDGGWLAPCLAQLSLLWVTAIRRDRRPRRRLDVSPGGGLGARGRVEPSEASRATPRRAKSDLLDAIGPRVGERAPPVENTAQWGERTRVTHWVWPQHEALSRGWWRFAPGFGAGTTTRSFDGARLDPGTF